MSDAEKELARTLQELEALRTEYEELTYVVSHDLGGSLRAIEGFTDIISKKHVDRFDDKTKRQFSLITHNTTKGKVILEVLLEFSRLNTKSEPFSEVNCNALVEEAKQSLADLIMTSKAIITSTSLPTVTGDRKQLALLFQNLLKNALIFQESGNQSEIFIQAEKKGENWQFALKDNGIGIQSNLTEKIFRILRRAVGEDEYSGAGMGLAVARKIVKRHQGDIWVESEIGTGSIFFFTISSVLQHD